MSIITEGSEESDDDLESINPVEREIAFPENENMEEEMLENEFNSENDEFSEELTPGNDDEFETDQGSLPDLEDDPVQAQEHVVRVNHEKMHNFNRTLRVQS